MYVITWISDNLMYENVASRRMDKDNGRAGQKFIKLANEMIKIVNF